MSCVPVWPADHNIVLTGFMGTGKSTVGRAVAARLGYDFVDTDDIIEARHGSVASIFEARGESGFRQLEHEVARKLATVRRTVIATGGRLMLDDRNVAALASSSRLCCLVAPSDEIVERVMSDSGRHERPLLQSMRAKPADQVQPSDAEQRQRLQSRVEHLLTERDDGYRRFLRVMTSQRTPDAIADEIVGAFAMSPTSTATPASAATPSIVVGVSLLSVLAELVGPIGRVEGEQAATYAPQIGVAVGERVVTIGPTPGVDPSPSTVWVPTVSPADSPGLSDVFTRAALSPRPGTTVVDVAVLQAAANRSWNEILDEVIVARDQVR